MPAGAVLFDLDGTLLDSLRDIADSMNAVLEGRGYETHPVDAYRHFVGEGMERLVHRTLPPSSHGPEEIEARLQDLRKQYGRRWADTTRPYDGIEALLDGLVERGLPLAVLSNKPDDFTRQMVERLLPRWTFSAVRGMRPDTPAKPDPAGALAIAAQIGVAPPACVYVGDTSTDMQTGRAAEMITVGVSWGFRDRDELQASGAHRVIDAPGQLLALIDESIRSETA
jgi:phosphoglycolate phosphatase